MTSLDAGAARAAIPAPRAGGQAEPVALPPLRVADDLTLAPTLTPTTSTTSTGEPGAHAAARRSHAFWPDDARLRRLLALAGAPTVGGAAAVALGAPLGVAAATSGGWALLRWLLDGHRGHGPASPVEMRTLAATFLAGSVLVTLVGAPVPVLQQVLAVAAAASTVAGALRACGATAPAPPRVVLVGAGAEEGLERRRRRDPVVLGRCEIDPETGRPGPVHPATLTDEPVDLDRAVEEWGVDLVALAPDSGLDADAVRELSWRLERRGTAVALLGERLPAARHRVRLSRWAGRPMLVLAPPRAHPLVRTAKCCLDRALGAALLVLVAPLLALLMLAVRLDSAGPAVFRQTRVGRDGRLFTMYKLRTMRVGAERLRPVLEEANEADAVLFKIRHDPRVTRVGRLLRRTSLDELPQLYNVVRGDMSLVGPRPALPSEVAQYGRVARRRLAVRPGLTGLWQVNGRADLDWERSVELDVRYTDNITISGDLAICLRTVRAVVGGRGAY